MIAFPRFQPGDILGCAGDSFVSKAIAIGTCKLHQLWRGEWFSHVAIAAPYYGDQMVWESTTLSPVPCDIRDVMVSGVQAHEPEKWLRIYPGKVWRFRLRKNNELTGLQARHLGEMLTEDLDAKYDMENAILAGTHWTKRLFWKAPDQSSFFCDELVAQRMQDLRVIPKVFNAQEITPAWLCWFVVHTGLYMPGERIK